ncbi:unnamed protein product [marine sediment metagenome]|uniref:Uncharacterized protein n=1 Tax=marine sediment metagenome TaxID=412755 RepID=X1F6G1_9ZZZZ
MDNNPAFLPASRILFCLLLKSKNRKAYKGIVYKSLISYTKNANVQSGYDRCRNKKGARDEARA